MLDVGFATADITPQLCLPLDGYAARKVRATGQLDPLRLRAAYLRNGHTSVAFLVLDGLGVSASMTEAIRVLVAEAFHGHGPNVVVAASHSHAGPIGLATDVEDDGASAHREAVISQAVKAVQEAEDRAVACTCRYGLSPTQGIVSHRGDPSITVDNEVRIVVFESSTTKRLVGVIANFACHPTVLGPDNTAYSGDLFGRAATLVEQSLGIPCVLTNGAEAEVSTRFTRSGRTADSLEALAVILGQSIRHAIAGAGSQTDSRLTGALRIVKTSISVPTRGLPSVSEAEDMVERMRSRLAVGASEESSAGRLRVLQSRLEGAKLLLEQVVERAGTSGPSDGSAVDLELDAVSLGGLVLLTVPGELSSTVLQRSLPSISRVWVIGLANGYEGYFPDPDQADPDSYEGASSHFDLSVTTAICEALSVIALEAEEEPGPDQGARRRS